MPPCASCSDFTTATITNNETVPVDPTTGLVFVAGTIKCSTDDTFDLSVEVSQEQKVRRASDVVKASGKVTVNCSKTAAQPWGIVLAPLSGEFSNGSAMVTTKTDAALWVIPAVVSTPVKLYWARK